MPETLDRRFAEKLLATFDDPQQAPVHLLFNQWWLHAPESVKEKYLADFESIPAQREFLAARHFAEPLDLETLGQLPEGTLGRGYRDFLVANGLEKNLAIGYRALHETMKARGALDGMPEPFQYAVLRGFQIHDLLHVLTGYDSSPRGELALQAFCLAQIRFPYAGMWMSVVCTRMTFLDPDVIRPAMDAISAGWAAGRHVANVQFGRWEQHVDQPLDELRQGLRIPPNGLGLSAAEPRLDG